MEIKDKNKVIRITAVTGWFIIMGYFLKLHFSTYSLCVLLISGGYLSYKTFLGKQKQNKADKTEALHLSDSIDRMIGITSVTLLGYYIFTLWPLEFIKWKGEDYSNLSISFFTGLTDIFRKDNFILLLVIIGVFIMGIIKINPAKNKILNVLYQYMSAAAVFFFLFYSWTKSVRIGLLYIAITVIYFVGDLIQWGSHSVEKIKRNKWYIRFSLLLFFFLLLERPAASSMSKEGYLEHYILVKGFSITNIVLLSVVFIISGVICWIYEDNKETVQGWFLYLITESALLVCYISYKFYVGYWWLILAAYIVISAGFILRSQAIGKTVLTKEGPVYYLLIPFTTIFIIYEAHNGNIISSLVLIGSIILLLLIKEKLRNEKRRWKSTAWLTTFSVIFMGVLAAVRVYEVRHLISNYLTLFIIGAFFILLIWCSCYNPDLYVQKFEVIQCGVIICMFAILCTSVCFKSGSSVKIKDLNKNEVTVSVKPKGKDNSIKKIEVYWLDDYTDAILINGEKKPLKEVRQGKIPEKYTAVLSKSGRLKVVAEDKHGMKTTRIKWFRICNYTEEAKK